MPAHVFTYANHIHIVVTPVLTLTYFDAFFLLISRNAVRTLQ